jgi:hypothetical protein
VRPASKKNEGDGMGIVSAICVVWAFACGRCQLDERGAGGSGLRDRVVSKWIRGVE